MLAASRKQLKLLVGAKSRSIMSKNVEIKSTLVELGTPNRTDTRDSLLIVNFFLSRRGAEIIGLPPKPDLISYYHGADESGRCKQDTRPKNQREGEIGPTGASARRRARRT
jgi:hypothetical protein